MRRTAATPPILALVLGAVLLPATALGLLRSSAEPAGERTGDPSAELAPAPAQRGEARTDGAAAAGHDDRATGRPGTDLDRGGRDVRIRPTTVDASTHDSQPPTDDPAVIVRPVVPPAADVRPVDRPVHQIRLACELVRTDVPHLTDALTIRPDIEPAVACHWSAVDVDGLRGYQLWRAVDAPDGDPRALIATIPAGQPLRHLDRDVSRGHVYTYAVVAIALDGTKIGLSNLAVVKIPPLFETLRMACDLAGDGDRRGVACRWTEAHHPAVAGYVLWRSVNGGPREAIYRTWLDGRLWFIDTKVEPGQSIRYAVVGVDKLRRPVAFGGPVLVRIPAPEIKPVYPGP